jgi:hypothetical protein
VPVWYWITYIPQLLTSLSHKEARLARGILIKIAKNYPQVRIPYLFEIEGWLMVLVIVLPASYQQRGLSSHQEADGRRRVAEGWLAGCGPGPDPTTSEQRSGPAERRCGSRKSG